MSIQSIWITLSWLIDPTFSTHQKAIFKISNKLGVFRNNDFCLGFNRKRYDMRII